MYSIGERRVVFQTNACVSTLFFARTRRKKNPTNDITLPRARVNVAPLLEVDAVSTQMLLERFNVALGKHLVPMVWVASVKDGVLPLNDLEVTESLEAVIGSATEVSLTDFFGSTPEFSDEFLFYGMQGLQMGNRLGW
jgi:hypothetical protein